MEVKEEENVGHRLMIRDAYGRIADISTSELVLASDDVAEISGKKGELDNMPPLFIDNAGTEL